MVGAGLLLAAAAYVLPFSAPAKAALAWTFLPAGALSVGYLVWRGSASHSTAERRDHAWGAGSVALNTAITALLLAEKLGWALAASGLSVILAAAEHRGRRGEASRT